jgi:hypothetical protein
VDRCLSSALFTASFSADKTLTRKSYDLTTARDVGFKEEWLQQAIAENPELVLAPCRAAGLINETEPWAFWGDEVPVEAGNIIDVLLVSESGRVAIVETKLAYNPEARREVVAQVLEYAIHLPSSSVSDLPSIPKRDDGRPFVDMEKVQRKLEEGDYLLVIAGDRLESRAVKLSEALLGRHLVRPWDLALVEVAVFQRQTESGQPEHLLVPHLRGVLVADRRQVVSVEVKGDRTRLTVETIAPVAISRAKWTEEEFFAHAREHKVSESTIQAMEKLLDGFKDLSADIVWGAGTEWGSFNPKWASICTSTVFQVWSSGSLSINFYSLKGSEAATSFRDRLKEKMEQVLKFSVPADYRNRQPNYKDSVWVPKVALLLEVLKELIPQHQ